MRKQAKAKAKKNKLISAKTVLKKRPLGLFFYAIVSETVVKLKP